MFDQFIEERLARFGSRPLHHLAERSVVKSIMWITGGHEEKYRFRPRGCHYAGGPSKDLLRLSRVETPRSKPQL